MKSEVPEVTLLHEYSPEPRVQLRKLRQEYDVGDESIPKPPLQFKVTRKSQSPKNSFNQDTSFSKKLESEKPEKDNHYVMQLNATQTYPQQPSPQLSPQITTQLPIQPPTQHPTQLYSQPLKQLPSQSPHQYPQQQKQLTPQQNPIQSAQQQQIPAEWLDLLRKQNEEIKYLRSQVEKLVMEQSRRESVKDVSVQSSLDKSTVENRSIGINTSVMESECEKSNVFSTPLNQAVFKEALQNGHLTSSPHELLKSNATFGDLRIDSGSYETTRSERIIDMPEFNNMSSSERFNQSVASPLLGESVSMYQQGGLQAVMPHFEVIFLTTILPECTKIFFIGKKLQASFKTF